ncbi:MAG: hypothetical protein M1819_001346 [Sarea resinae]|nr:MAG: hypothetical protein M1819_001346 [Sarea resinae]
MATDMKPSMQTSNECPPPPETMTSKVDPSVRSVGSSGLADPILLDRIDQLFACNVGEYIDLPQLVVVGDQSSGKSSVLEGLTNLPFPRDSGLCTRFATQITFRRSSQTRIAMSIMPARGASQEHTEKLQSWKKSDMPSLDASSSLTIMTEVQNIMGLADKGTTSTFSEDVLRLEICGPQEEHLSVIDVPGIFKKTTPGLTTKADIGLVRNMVHTYMKNPRSVMLAVVPANVDIATQEILDMAEEVDKEGVRTLGVLTKPDLVDKGAEAAVTDLIKGNKHQLRLGWHLVRNLGQRQLSDASHDRLSLERHFFASQSPWNTLEKEKIGVHSLRTRLQEILANHIRREFPKVKSEINKKLKNSRQTLQKLGAKRETQAQQTQYLLLIATEFQHLTSCALNASYGSHTVFDEHQDLKLATAVMNRNERLSRVMEHSGHTFQSGSGGFNDGNPVAVTKSKVPPEAASEEDMSDVSGSPEPITKNGTHNALKVERSQKRQYSSLWFKYVYQTSRGFELGTFDSRLLAITMKRQSANWDGIALGYISDIIAIVHHFIHHMLEVVCPNDRVRASLLSILTDSLIEKYKTALHRQRRIREAADSYRKTRPGAVISVDDLASSLSLSLSMSNADHVVHDIHDILRAYYRVARKRFVDNVCMYGADYHLVTWPDTPLKFFSSVFITSMTQAELEDVAGEDAMVKRQRAALEKEIRDLENGRKILI